MVWGEENDQEAAGEDKVVENRDSRKRVGMLLEEEGRRGGGGRRGGRERGSRGELDEVQGKGGTKEHANIVEDASVGVLLGVGGEEGGETPVWASCGGRGWKELRVSVFIQAT